MISFLFKAISLFPENFSAKRIFKAAAEHLLKKKIVNGVPTFYTNLYSLVVRIKDGKITDLIWDNDCGLCSGLTCFTETLEDDTPTDLCEVQNTCNATTYEASCDPKIYVTWVGTDVDGAPMTSAGMRLSQFVQYSISGLYYEAQGLVNNAVKELQNNNETGSS